MKILIVSDSHGRIGNLSHVIDKVSPIDMLIHLGDFEGHEDEVELLAGCSTYMVGGNNDYFSNLDREKVIHIGNDTIFMCHGHRYGVNFGVERIKEVGRQLGANIVMFGHTHKPMIDLSDDVAVINPGSITQPRQEGRVPTYIIMDVDQQGKSHFTLNYYE